MAKKHYTKKQVITILNSLGQRIIEFDVGDLDMDLEDIDIKSSYDVRREDMQAIDRLQLLIPFVKELGSEFSYRKLLRDIAEKVTGDPDRALTYIDYMWEEIQAQQEVPILNNEEKGVSWKVEDVMGEVHEAFIARYNQAKESPDKILAIKNRYEALKEKKKALKKQATEAAAA